MAALSAFRRDLEVFLNDTTSVEGRREIFIGIARPTLAEFESDWRTAIGGDPGVETFVDGVKGAALEAVRIPGGVVAARVAPVGPIVDRALELYDLFVKVVTGDYAGDVSVFVNDAPASRAQGSTAAGSDQVAITNLSPFARKAEVRGFNDRDGSNFPNGLFEGLAAVLRAEFRGSPIPIREAWRSFGGKRLPSILIN